MDEQYKRRIRIVSPPDSTYGRFIRVTDLDTQEEITNVTFIRLYLDATGDSYAKVTYYPFDEHGQIMEKDGEPIARTNRIDNPEVAVSALEEKEQA